MANSLEEKRDDLDYSCYIEELFLGQGVAGGYNLEFVEGAEDVLGVSREELMEIEPWHEEASMGITRVVKEEREEMVLFEISDNDPWGNSKKFPHNFADYPELSKIQIGYNYENHPFERLPHDIDKLINLKELVVSNSQLDTIPASIGNFPKLKSLNLSGNKLTGIPPKIGDLPKLEHLGLSGNKLTGIPPEIGNLKNLKSLNISYNQLTKLPEELSQLRSLVGLYINNNPISDIPKAYSQLKQLEKFSIHEMNLSTLDDSIWDIVIDRNLSLNGNSFSELPQIVLSSDIIESIDLRDNRFTKIPDLRAMNNLKSINIKNNPINMADEGNKTILECNKLEAIYIGKDKDRPEWLINSEIFAPKN